jgi:uncharacterized protein (DUF736 family)
MTYQQKPNTGSLFANTSKQSDKHPDRRGQIHLSREFLEKMMQQTGDLVVMDISAWENVSASGMEYLGLSIQAPYVKQAKPEPEPKPKPRPEPELLDDDSEIPF